MFGGGRGMGGGGGGGGSMLKVVGRTVARAAGTVTNIQDPVSSGAAVATSPKSRPTHKFGSSTNNVTLSSGSGSGCGSPFSAAASSVPVAACSRGPGPTQTRWPSFAASSESSCGVDEYEWVPDEVGIEDDGPLGLPDDFVLGPVPSLDEVNSAISALTQVLDTASYSEIIKDKYAYFSEKDDADEISCPTRLLQKVSSVGSELDWMEPSLHLCNPRTLNSYGPNRVYDAFHCLQTDPSVQKIVISLSSDKAVWDAVLNNEVVRELRAAYYADEIVAPPISESSDETGNDSNPALDIIKWIFDSAKAQVMGVMEKLAKLVNDLFKPHDEKASAGARDPFEEKLRTSFLLSVVVLLIVVVTRAHGA